MVLSETHRQTGERRRRRPVQTKINERSQFFTLPAENGPLKSITYDSPGRLRVNN
jgi:hypothetical protein